MDNLIGRSINQYELLEEIGRGGMAVVYKAYQSTLSRYVAVKVLPPHFTFDRQFVERFRREAQAAARLQHPNIVDIYDVGVEDGVHYIVMELLSGRTLTRLVADEGPLPPERTSRIAGQVAAALDHAHRRGVVHRDVKPANIFVDQDDHATLTDFGIAIAASGTRLTQTGAVVGTPEYMSPEQAQGQEVDHRTDVYALGTVVYEMLTGRVPFDGTTPQGVLYGHVNRPPPPPRELNPALSPAVEAIVLKALDKDPARRFQHCGELAAALQQAAAGGVGVPVPGRRVSPWLWAGIGLAALVLLALAIVWLLGGADSELTRARAPAAGTSVPTATAVLPASSTPATAGSVQATVSLPPLLPSTTPTAVAVPPTATPQPTPTPEPPTPTPTGAPPRPIVFHSNQGNNYEIYTILPDGSGALNLTRNPASDKNPGWSPDGQWIVFDSDRSGRRSIWRMRADGSDLRQLASGPGEDLAPDWSPDGARIVFASSRSGSRELHVMGADGSDPMRLTDHPGSESHPDWSPDGQWIAFNAAYDGNHEIYRIPATGGEAVRLTFAAGDDSAPDWSPDGGWLAFDSNRRGSYDIWRMDADGGAQTCFYCSGAINGFPAWSPDGRWLVFDSNMDGGGENWQLYIMRKNGSDLRRVTHLPGEHWYPGW